MSNTYKLTFTQDRENFMTLVIPAPSLVDAYIEIQLRFPDAEITEVEERDTWAQSIAKYMMANATLDELCAFASFLDEAKREELVNAIWDEWHKNKSKFKGGVNDAHCYCERD